MSREDPGRTPLTSLHLRRAKAGDRASLDWLVDHLSPLLLAQARYRLGSRLRAHIEPEDLVQEAWALAFPRLGELQARDGRETPVLLRFLGTTLLHQVNNLARQVQRRALAGDGDLEPEDTGPGPVTRVAIAERQHDVQRCIDALPEIHREILVLRGIEQQEIADIALLLELEPNTVAQRWRRALEQLRQRLPGSVFDELE